MLQHFFKFSDNNFSLRILLRYYISLSLTYFEEKNADIQICHVLDTLQQ
jgi:hypothetical protein